jgi:hypothetical protein
VQRDDLPGAIGVFLLVLRRRSPSCCLVFVDELQFAMRLFGSRRSTPRWRRAHPLCRTAALTAEGPARPRTPSAVATALRPR